jgi:dUTP pyrophosphatase
MSNTKQSTPIVKIVSPYPIEQQTEQANGYDICSNRDILIRSTERVMINTGVFIDFPEGIFGLLLVRSSVGKRGLSLTNGVGLIDTDYKGEILMSVQNFSKTDILIQKGDRIGQIVFMRHTPIVLETSTTSTNKDTTEPTKVKPKAKPKRKRKGGFGSTDDNKDKEENKEA